MTDPIKHCPQPDPPELVRRADGYHYRTEDEMKELTDEDLDRLMKENVPTAVRCPPGWRNAFRAVIAAHVALNAADRDVMRQAPEGWKLVPVEPNLDQYNAACRAYCDWQVKCQDEARKHEDEFDNAWEYSQPNFTHSDVYRAMLAVAPTPPAEQPIDMVLHCPACGKQHIDAPDWQNEPQFDAVQSANAKQGTDIAGDREAQQPHDESVQVLLRDGGVASGGHAEHALQEVRLSTETIHGNAQDMHSLQEEDACVRVLSRQEDWEPEADVQDVQQARDGRVAKPEPGDASGRTTAPQQDRSREAQVWPHTGGVSGSLGGEWPAVRHLRQDGAADAQTGGAIAGSLPHDRQHQRGALLSMQHNVGVRERRLDVTAQRDQISGEVPIRAPIHRSHLCRPEDGGCGHIWRPADVATSGVAAIKTHGKNDSPPAEQQSVAYLDVGSEGYLDLDTDKSDDELQKLSPGRHPLYLHPSPSIANLRAKVEALPTLETAEGHHKLAFLSDVLAEIDKMGGKV